MKYEVGTTKPESLKEYWPGQYDIFSYFEYISGIPHTLFLITTLKENGKTNACFHSWSSFSGDSGGFFAIMPGVLQSSHTYKNILREKEFCVNFISKEYYDACQATVNNNSDDTDELIDAGFTPEQAVTVKVPRIKEAFLTFECKLVESKDLSGKGIGALIIGEVSHAAIDENHKDIENVLKNFMFYVHAPKNLKTGEGEKGAIAGLKFERYE